MCAERKQLPDDILEAALFITERIEDFIIDDVVNDPTKLDKAYKRAADIMHPDHGGSHEEFITLQASLDVLKRWHGNIAIESKLDDENTVELDLAHLLEEIGGELQGIAEKLRRAPFFAVERRLLNIQNLLIQTCSVSFTIRLGDPEVSLKLFQEIRERM